MGIFQSVSQYYSYPAFMQLMEELVASGRTTGVEQKPSFVFYTKLNLQRMQKWEKIFEINEPVAALMPTVKPQVWWVINEAWCGDAAQSLPVMQKMAEAANGNIDIRIILRDEHPAIMDKYLTNGGRSIPKLIAVDKEDNELFTWGPRPAFAQKMMMDWKANPNSKTYDEIEKDLHLWYAKDKGQSVQLELLEILSMQVQ